MSPPNPISRAGESADPERDSRPRGLTGVVGRLLGAEPTLWSLAVAAMLGDVALTVIGLQLGLVELNPIARHVLDTSSVVGLCVLKLLTLGIGVCCRPLLPDRHTAVVPLALLLPSLAAVLINTTLVAVVV